MTFLPGERRRVRHVRGLPEVSFDDEAADGHRAVTEQRWLSEWIADDGKLLLLFPALAGGVRLRGTLGHSPGHLSLDINSGGQHALVTGNSRVRGASDAE
jgi:glyoxylase-like metal-dependent hydrolase (beta-lactamase superfamily II)